MKKLLLAVLALSTIATLKADEKTWFERFTEWLNLGQSYVQKGQEVLTNAQLKAKELAEQAQALTAQAKAAAETAGLITPTLGQPQAQDQTEASPAA